MSIRPRSPSNETSGPQSKRACATRPGTIPVQRNKSFYFEDGNIVLLASDLNDQEKKLGYDIAFRIHRGVLARTSSVFADMFTLPAQANMDTYDGVPSVFLHGDSAKDVECLLSALYNPAGLPFERGNHESALEVAGALRLSKKYMMDDLYKRIAAHLERDWPATLREWDISESVLEILESRWYEKQDSSLDINYFDDAVPEPASAIRVARENDVTRVLPSAFYHLSRLSIICDSEAQREQDDQAALYEGMRTARRNLLQREDLECLLRGKENIDEFVSSMGPRITSQNCKAKDKDVRSRCIVSTHEFWRTLKEQAFGTHDPLSEMSQYKLQVNKEPREMPDSICRTCQNEIRMEIERHRTQLWEKLPELFGLEVKRWNEWS